MAIAMISGIRSQPRDINTREVSVSEIVGLHESGAAQHRMVYHRWSAEAPVDTSEGPPPAGQLQGCGPWPASGAWRQSSGAPPFNAPFSAWKEEAIPARC